MPSNEIPLTTIRDLLFPGLVHHAHRRFGLERKFWHFDLIVADDGETINLLVAHRGRMYLKTLLSKDDIADNSFRDKFGPRVIYHLDTAAADLMQKGHRSPPAA